jgi:hypothetical protein
MALAWKVGSLAVSSTPAASSAGPQTTSVPSYAAGSTAGALTAQFPPTLVPHLPGSQLLSSSAEPTKDGKYLQVSLSLRTSASAKSALATCRKTLEAHGFTQVSGHVDGADAGATFRRVTSTTATGGVGDVTLADFIVVAVVDEKKDRLVTISGQVPAPKSASSTSAPTSPSTKGATSTPGSGA